MGSRRLRIAAFAFLLVIGTIASAAAAPAPFAVPVPMRAADRYSQCLARARKTPQAALAEAEDWVRAGGGFPAKHCAAVALIGLKRYAEAAQRLEALAGDMMGARDDLRAGALEQAGQAWLLAGKPHAAKAAFDAALQLRPNEPDLLIDRAQAYDAMGKLWDAIDDLNDALAIDPDRADALIFRASAYRRVGGGLALAQADIDRALKLAPNSVPGLLERGNIRSLTGDLAGARADWLKVERLAPSSPAAVAAKENLTRLAQLEKAPAAGAPQPH